MTSMSAAPWLKQVRNGMRRTHRYRQPRQGGRCRPWREERRGEVDWEPVSLTPRGVARSNGWHYGSTHDTAARSSGWQNGWVSDATSWWETYADESGGGDTNMHREEAWVTNRKADSEFDSSTDYQDLLAPGVTRPWGLRAGERRVVIEPLAPPPSPSTCSYPYERRLAMNGWMCDRDQFEGLYGDGWFYHWNRANQWRLAWDGLAYNAQEFLAYYGRGWRQIWFRSVPLPAEY